MTRILGIILLLIVLRMAWKSLTIQLRAAVFGPPTVPKAPPPPRAAVAETLVQCATCGAYTPASRALQAAKGYEMFCSEECRRSAAR